MPVRPLLSVPKARSDESPEVLGEGKDMQRYSLLVRRGETRKGIMGY